MKELDPNNPQGKDYSQPNPTQIMLDDALYNFHRSKTETNDVVYNGVIVVDKGARRLNKDLQKIEPSNIQTVARRN